MKTSITFFKDRIITGIIVLVPATILSVLLADVVKKIIKITSPITKKIAVGGVITETVVAALIIVVVLSLLFFLTGVIFKTKPGLKFQHWLQESFFQKIPLYKTLRGITLQLTGVNKSNYPVVEVDLYDSNAKSLGLLTDKLSDERYVVYLPFAPILNIGQIFVVPSDKVKVLDISLKDASDIITQIGFEASSIYKSNNPKNADSKG